MTKLKTPLALLSFLFFLASCGSKDAGSENIADASNVESETATAPTSGKYQIKSGIVNFEVEMIGEKTKKVLYFDDYGAKERTEEYNEDGTLKEYRMSDGKTRYTIVPSDKIAYLADENGSRGWEMEFASWSRITQQTAYEKDYAKQDNMTIAGKDSESYSYGGNTVFAGWNGITLYHKQGNAFVMRATTIEETPVDAALFTVPEGFEVKKFGN